MYTVIQAKLLQLLQAEWVLLLCSGQTDSELDWDWGFLGFVQAIPTHLNGFSETTQAFHYLRSSSCWKLNLCLRGFRLSKRLYIYLAPSIIPLILPIFSAVKKKKNLHSMMLPPPCFTVGMCSLCGESCAKTKYLPCLTKHSVLISFGQSICIF